MAEKGNAQSFQRLNGLASRLFKVVQVCCHAPRQQRIAMSLPVLFLLTSDAALTETLQAQLPELFEIQACDSLQDARRQLRQCRPWGIVADFRSPTQGGHAEDRFLDDVQET